MRSSSLVPTWAIGLFTVLILLAASGFAGYQQIFSTFVDYDDEGYVMMSLHNLLQGKPLYDETYTQYGPAFFQIHSALHTIFDLPVTHDVVRIKALVQWLTVCTLCFATLLIVTRSLALSAVGFTAVFCLLERICVEPGHPQDIAALSVAFVIALSTQFRQERSNRWLTSNVLLAALVAVIVGVVCMTKANIGVLLFFGVSTTLLVSAKKNQFLDVMTARVLVLAAAVPILLIAKYWSIQEATLLPLAAAASFGLVVAMKDRWQQTNVASVACLISFGSALVATVTISIFAAWLCGSSVQGLVDGIFLQHLGFGSLFFSPPPLSNMLIPAALASGVLAILFLRNQFWVLTLLRTCSIGIAAALLIQFFFETATPSGGGYEGRMHVKTLMNFAPLLSWIILFPKLGFNVNLKNQAEENCPFFFARMMLCFVSIFQLLICYPIPGSQIAMGTFPLIVVLLVAVSDFIKTDLPRIWTSQPHAKKQFAIVGLLMLVATSTLLYRDVSNWQRRQSFTPLSLPGASLIRLPDVEVKKYQLLTSYLKENSDTFVFRESTQNCVYFWTKLEPPTGANATIWPFMLNEQQQQTTVERLKATKRVVVVSSNTDLPLPEKNSPLASYISDNFAPELDVAGFKIWLPKKNPDKPVANSLSLNKS